MLAIVLLCLCFFRCVSASYFEDTLLFLHTYGYLDVKENEIVSITKTDNKFITALNLFQKTYNLTQSNTINNETLQFIKTPRCGVRDRNFRTHPLRWSTNNITWFFYGAQSTEINYLITKAFEVWSKHANINFFQSANINSNILISFAGARHYQYNRRAFCIEAFDGPGGVLAHADSPQANVNNLEIHIDNTENWNYEMKISGEGEESLFQILVHEIGHTLGLQHSLNPNAIMYAYYQNDILFNANNNYDIHSDDILAIEQLYGSRVNNNSTINNNKNEHEDINPKEKNNETVVDNSYPDLCELNNVNTFLIVNGRIYIFYEKWVWFKKLNEEMHESKPLLLTDWLPFLPKNFTKLSAVYQRPNGNIVIIINDKAFNVKFPSLQLDTNNNKNPYHDAITNISGSVHTNTGHTYIFYNNNNYIEVDECKFETLTYGVIDKRFPGIPAGVQSAFQYTNGRIYFFKDENYYEFNEFLNTLVKADKFNLNLFNINCPNISILEQIKNLLFKLWQYKIK